MAKESLGSVDSSLQAALQEVGVIDSAGNAVRGGWKTNDSFVIDGIPISLRGEFLVLRPAFETVFHGMNSLDEVTIHVQEGAAKFAEILAECSQSTKTKKAQHMTRVYGNEW